MSVPLGTAEDASARAVDAVDALLEDPESDPGFEPESPGSARAAIERFAARFASADGWVKVVIEGARSGAQGLSGDRLQGLEEIVQNADDADARSVRIALSEDALLVAHNGRLVTLGDVFALATPWVTTKSANASATGRFGIGLMTLQSLSSTLEVYSGHYRIRLGNSTIAVVDDPNLPDDFTRPGETVLRIPLEPGVLDAATIDAWFARWDEAALLFCSHVKSITVSAGGHVVRTLRMRWEDPSEDIAEIGGAALRVRRRYAHASDGRRWSVHTVDAPPPPGVNRARKAVDTSTPLGVALPLHDELGQLYAGLPVTGIRYPARINAQFDPLTGRQGLADSPWNNALCPLIADLWMAAATHLFDTEPSDAWRIVPLLEPADDPQQSIVARLEALLLAVARTVLPERLTFQVANRAVPLADLAVEAPRLEGILTGSEISALAGLDVALPAEARDSGSHWRQVLTDWREAGAHLTAPVTVEAALALFSDVTRQPGATISLADEGLGDELASLRCVVTEDNRRIRPPASTDPWLLAPDVSGLAGELELVRPLHTVHLADADDARAVFEWLKHGAIGDPADSTGVVRRLAASGQAGRRLDGSLTDRQLRALRDAFEPLTQAERAAFGLGIGQAIAIEAYQFDRRGRRVPMSAPPAETYLPRAIEGRPDGFAVAAAKTPGLTWAQGRYADALRSPLGRAGLGAQRFLHLLGVEIAPRLTRHRNLERRFWSEQRQGLRARVPDNAPGRGQALAALGATFSLEDMDSPDLAAVLTNIGIDRKANRRRARAAAVLATLGRAWDRIGDFAEVTAADDHYSWQTKGSVRAFRVWRAATIAWLDDSTATPRPPGSLRLRTPSTVAVHGPKATGYIHKDVLIQHYDVLAALGVTGDPSTGDLIKRLRELRDTPEDPTTIAGDAALIYQGLADRLAGRIHIPGDLSAARLRQAFSDGAGLVRTNLGWRPPTQVLSGKPVFGNRRPFVPQVPSADRLWDMLHIRRPAIDDCVAVLTELARTRSSLDLGDQTIELETLRLLADLVRDASLTPALRRRLAKLPVWTTQGWQTARPVYAIDDPVLALGLATEVPVWRPGGELAQFRALLGRLRLTELPTDSTTVVDAAAAIVDEEATALLQAAVPLLREDLARNDPATGAAVEVGWDRLERFEVRVTHNLRVRVGGLADAPPVVFIAAKADPDAGVLYLNDPELLARVDGGGRAIAGLFAADRRSVAQAWLAACDNARAGREALRLQLAEERSAAEEAQTTVDIADRLAAFRHQTEAAHARGGDRVARPTGASADPTAATGTVSTAPPPPAPSPRVLVDPSRLRVADPSGHLVGGRASTMPGSAGARRAGDVERETTKDLPSPRPDGATPHHTAVPPSYTAGTKESIGLDLVRMVLASDADDMRDLRAQHGVGADAVDALERFFELKVYAGAEPDRITLEDAQIRRAMSTPNFFLVVVSGVEGQNAAPKVRIIVDPLRQLEMTETSSVSFTGVRASQSLLHELVRDE
jgi:hypothetical protein